MNKKLIIILAAVIAAAGVVIAVMLLAGEDTPPKPPVTVTEDAPDATAPTESATPTIESNEPTAEAPETTEAPTEETPTEEAPEERINEIYTSHDPLRSFRLTFDGSRISVEGVYKGETAMIASLGKRNDVRFSYNGDVASAVLEAVPSEGVQELRIRFASGENLIIFIGYDENGLPQPFTTAALQSNALALSRPLTIPAENSAEYILTGGSSEDRAAILDAVRKISDDVCKGLSSDYDKARALAEWVSRNISYDFEACSLGVSVETLCLGRTLELKRSVCGGFSNLYAALCQAQGLTCYVVKGDIVQGGGYFGGSKPEAIHEWNVLELDGRHIWVDTLWNTDNAFYGDEYVYGDQRHTYFDMSDECISVNHRARRVEMHIFY